MFFPTNEKRELSYQLYVFPRGRFITASHQNRDITRKPTSVHPVKSTGNSDLKPEKILLSDLIQWREQLARNIARNNYGARSNDISNAVNQIIFRLLFLLVAEDRSLIDAGTIKKIHESDDPYTALVKISQKIDDLWIDLDGNPQKNVLTKNPVIENSLMKTILLRLSSAERPYHFAAIPTEAIAQIFRHYLTRTIRRSAMHQAVIVDTYDKTQYSGISDPTPAMIDYMVQSTLDAVRSTRSQKEILPIRILDPACGSGFTLLCAFKHLIDAGDHTFFTFTEKKEILLNSIYGVDIDRHAIAVAKILLVIKLCEEEQAESLPGDFFTVAGEVFRELYYTIRCGNALIDPEIMNDESWTFCSPRERHSLNPFEWSNRYPEIFAAGGFDAVIGNPPDGTLESREWIQRYFQRHYAAYHPMIDRSAYFIEKGLSLLRRNGMLGFIMSDRWFRGKAGSPLRSVVKMYQIEELVYTGEPGEGTNNSALCIIRIANCISSHAFFVTRISPSFKGQLFDYIPSHRYTLDPAKLDDDSWALRDTRMEDIFCKVQQSGTPLEDYVMGQVFPGIKIGLEGPFFIDEALRKQFIKDDPGCKSLIRRFVAGTGITRYQTPKNPNYLIFIPKYWTDDPSSSIPHQWRRFKSRHPSIARHLKLSFEKAKTPRKPGDHWWETSCEEIWRGKHPKIFFRNRFKRPAFVFDEGWAIADHTVGVIPSSNLYLLGLLNSRLMFLVFNNFIQISGTEQKMHSWDDLKNLPIYTPDFENPDDNTRHDRMVALVTEMLELHMHLSDAKTNYEKRIVMKEIESIDRQIDSLAYGLYGLKADEIKIIEECGGK